MAELSDREFNEQINQNLAFFENRNIQKNLINNSVAEKPRRVINNWQKTFIAGAALGGSVVIIISSFMTMINNKLAEKKSLNEALNKYNNKEIITVVKEAEETYRSPGQLKYSKNHNAYEIADYLINKSDNFHQDLYVATEELDKVSEYTDDDVERVVDNVLAYTSNLNDENNPNFVLDYKSWKDYCLRHGFVDENGEPSLEKYSSEMTQYMADKTEIDKFDNEHGTRGYR